MGPEHIFAIFIIHHLVFAPNLGEFQWASEK